MNVYRLLNWEKQNSGGGLAYVTRFFFYSFSEVYHIINALEMFCSEDM